MAKRFAAFLVFAVLCAAVPSQAQVTAAITGSVKDSSGAVVPGATVSVKHVETGLTRTAVTDATGNYTVTSIPIGHYEVTGEAPGFEKEVRSGIELVVGQTAVINLTLAVGTVQQQVTVTGEAPLVNTTTSNTSGVISEQQVKDIPLNGRSIGQLLALTANANNFANAGDASRGAFSLSGKRYETNRWMINGIDFLGTDSTGQLVLPIGSSNDLLGVDAVQEFNVQGEDYGANLGRKAGAQISVVTTSGTNNIHGDLFEFLRNTDTDASSFFAPTVAGVAPTVLKRNQFGGSLGGPIKKDKLFFFASYEGVRQDSATGAISYIPDEEVRNGFYPNSSGVYTQVAGLNPGMLPLVQIAWPDPATFPGGCSETHINGEPTGVCSIISAPPSTIREDYSLSRLDYNISSTDTYSTSYLWDNGITRSAGTLPISGSEAPLASQLLSIQETHIFSPTLLNVATAGFSRAYANSTPVPYMLYNGPQSPIPSIAYFINGPLDTPGEISVGGGSSGAAISTSTLSLGLGSSSGPLSQARNAFTWADDVHYTQGRHNISMGVWVQRLQNNSSASPSSTDGEATFASITTMLQGTVGTFLAVPQRTELGWRTTEYAYYWQDDIKLKHNLDVRVGLRMEGDTGYNEHTGRDSNFYYTNGYLLNNQPTIGYSAYNTNNATDLWQPRIGLAWDPTGSGKWAIRAGFGIYNDLQDDLNHRLMANPPFNTRVTYTNVPFLEYVPIASTYSAPICSTPVATASTSCVIPELGGVEPDAHVPTIQQWSFTIERQLAKDLLLHIGYIGLEAYHDVNLEDLNQTPPQVCNNPAGCQSGGINESGIGVGTVPQGTYYEPQAINPATGTADGCRLNCNLLDTNTWMYDGTSSYNALNVFLQKRYSNGITFRANYTYSKVLDINSGLLLSEASNEPQCVYNIYDLGLNKGPAAYNLTQQFNFNFGAELPVGRGHAFAGNANRFVDGVIGGWQFNGVFTAQTGFPFTPELGSSDITGEGDTSAVDLPNVNPSFNGQLYNSRSITQYFNPAAFTLPLPGTFGDVERGNYTGPGFINMDASMFKRFRIREKQSLELRAEAFNISNHPNFSKPNSTVFTATGAVSATAGTITALAGANRQIQFGLKYIF